MYDGLNSPNIYDVKSVGEFIEAIQSHPDALIWAGGTFIMSEKDSYPPRKSNEDIIYLGNIEDLKRIQRNDRILEYGAMVSLDTVLNTNKNALPSLLEDNILSMGSSLITTRATVGGAISTQKIITSIPGTLVVLNANMEIRYVKRKKRAHSKWILLSHTLNKDGRITLPKNSLITKIRIAINNIDVQRFFIVGSFMKNPKDAVSLSFASNWNQDVLVNPHLAITFPLLGICYSRDIDNILSSLKFPLDDEEFSSFESIMFTFIESTFPNITRLQGARVRGILETLITELNNKALTVTSLLDDVPVLE